MKNICKTRLSVFGGLQASVLYIAYSSSTCGTNVHSFCQFITTMNTCPVGTFMGGHENFQRCVTFLTSRYPFWIIPATVFASHINFVFSLIKQNWDTKKREPSCCPFHVSRLLHCLLLLNRQRQSPRRYEYTPHRGKTCILRQFCTRKGTIHTCKISTGIDIITPGTSTVATLKTTILEFARLQRVSNTASNKRLQYVLESPFSHPTALRASTIRNGFHILGSAWPASSVLSLTEHVCRRQKESKANNPAIKVQIKIDLKLKIPNRI